MSDEYIKYKDKYYNQSLINQTSTFQKRNLYVKTLVPRTIMVPTYFSPMIPQNYPWSSTC